MVSIPDKEINSNSPLAISKLRGAIEWRRAY